MLILTVLLTILNEIVVANKHQSTGFDKMQLLKVKSPPVIECPDPCYCPQPERVDCSEANLQVVPRNISESALHILLNKNRLEILTSECFEECPLVQTLDLQHNLISDEGLSPSVFKSLNQLNHLLLSGNRLKFVPNGLPDSLVTLNLAGNDIKMVAPEILAIKENLRFLYLHDNKLTSQRIDKKSFQGLTQIEEITLTNNQIVSFPPIPPNAEVVYLHNNAIRTIPEGTFRRRRNVRILFLQNNKISNDGVKRKSFAGLRRIEYLDLSGNNLTKVPKYLPRRLKRLHLERNKISSISKSAMSRLKCLEYLLLHQNIIGPRSIESGTFSHLPHLNTLHMFGNKLQHIPAPLPQSLESLILLQNAIRRISRYVFNSHPNLKQLDLRHNQLTNIRIARGALRGMKRLITVDFTGNRFRAVPSLSRNITTLLLSSNRVVRIPRRSLSRMSQLRHLALDKNLLENEGIPRKAFKSNKHLTVLDLSENKLKLVPKFLPPNLEYIYLQKNMIVKISRKTFYNTVKLKEIFLQDNQLLPDTVSKAAFSPLRHLQRLDITWKIPTDDVTQTERKRRDVLTI